MIRLVTTVLVLFMVKYSAGNKTEIFSCYSCSYILSSDPTYDIECVNSPQDVTKGSPEITCQAPYQCVTKATFNPDRKTVRSLSRSCLPPGSVCEGPRCCTLAGVYPECEHKCRMDHCNSGDAKDLSDIMMVDDRPAGSAFILSPTLAILLPVAMSILNLRFWF
ncbi:hypothetical protein ACF0H5_011614 [Mactra antiquata]